VCLLLYYNTMTGFIGDLVDVNADKTKHVHGYGSRSECRAKSQYED
jgi:hypothetical protein